MHSLRMVINEQIRTVGSASYLLTKEGLIFKQNKGQYHDQVGKVSSEGEFNCWIESELEHQKELSKLIRYPINHKISEWGIVKNAEKWTCQKNKENISGLIHIIAENGSGLIVEEDLNKKVRHIWRNDNGHYDMEYDWAIIAYTFPKFFTKKEKEEALAILKNYKPHQFMCVTGIAVKEEESFILRQEKTLGYDFEKI